MGFLFAGDWHGSITQAHISIRTAVELGAKRIYHVGDIGVRYPRSAPDFEEKLVDLLLDHDVSLSFVDGNHSNHPFLRDLTLNGFSNNLGHKIVPGSSGALCYIPRGCTWVDDGVRFGGLGGASSLNRNKLQEGYDLWAELETPTINDVIQLGRAPVDVLITHDCPALVPLESNHEYPQAEVDATNVNRELLMEAVDQVKPNLVVSGHWHQFAINRTRTVGGHEYTSIVLDKETGANLLYAGTNFLRKNDATPLLKEIDAGACHAIL